MLLFVIGITVVVITGFIACVFPERIATAMIYGFNLNVYPLARQVAWLLYQCPTQWTSDGFRLKHLKVGSIWIANEAYGLKIETEFGEVHLNFIERRIIRDAVDWRLRGYLRDRVTVALGQSMAGAIPSPGEFHKVPAGTLR